ncbi:hypothetical protein D3C78_1379120 [compost metagenome]
MIGASLPGIFKVCSFYRNFESKRHCPPLNNSYYGWRRQRRKKPLLLFCLKRSLMPYYSREAALSIANIGLLLIFNSIYPPRNMQIF